jgi:hypothetical protein
MDLHSVKLILDIEAFSHLQAGKEGHYFAYREIGCVAVDKDLAWSYHFRIPIPNYEDQRLMKTLHRQQSITNLPLFLPGNMGKRQCQIKSTIRHIIKEHGSFNEATDKIGYKGGHLEKDLLDELNIFSLNLECIIFKKYDELINDSLLESVAKIWDCGKHYANSDNKWHCPRAEVNVFRSLLLKHLNAK